MKSKEFVEKLKKIATDYKTLYVNGCFGSPMNAKNKKRFIDNTDYNRQASRTAKINAASSDTFGFDCVCLIKGVLWGWNGDKTKTHGGAVYKTNGVPDINADQMIRECTDLSTDFSKIEVGEAVWMKGHIGVYIGDGLVVECTPVWKDGVQITACNRTKAGYNRRDWVKHGKLPYVEYETAKTPEKPVSTFLPARGYFKRGDSGEKVEKINEFWYKTFPGYATALKRTAKNVRGEYFGENSEAWTKEFQRRTGLEADGCIGPITLAEMKKYGFKE